MKMERTAYPYMVWLLIFIAAPFILLLILAFTKGDGQDFFSFQFTLENFKTFFSPIYLNVMKKSLVLALKTTVYTFIIAYPLALILANAPVRYRNSLVLLLVIPMWMNFLLRTYAWLTLLGRNGLINSFLIKLGLGPLNLIYTDKAVLLGMIYNFLPFMILPIYSTLIKIDRSLLEASEDLGATSWITLSRVILPLSIPGIMTGITMVFIPSASTFIISNLLGGNKSNLIGNIIEQQFRYTGNWHFGSALAIILMLVILVTIAITSLADKGKGGTSLW